MNNEAEENALYNENEFEKISLFSFIIGFFIFMFKHIINP